jgi:TPR repeat protein
VRTFRNLLRPVSRAAAAAAAAATVFVAVPAWASTKVALVIGVGGYESGGALPNTIGDAKLIATALQKLGFSVTTLTDPGRKDLIAAMDSFQRQAGGSEAALIYFAGHGVDIAGVNYLLPRDASNASAAALVGTGFEADRARIAVARATKVRLVILDACRNSPAGLRLSDVPNGLGRETGGSTSQVVTLMAAQPKQAALDGDGDHSPFALALANALNRPHLTIGELPRLVKTDVERTTANHQSPDLQGIWDDLYWSFDGKSGAAAEADITARTQRERTFWQSIRNSDDPADFEAYVEASDRGEFSGLYRSIALNRAKSVQARAPSRPAATVSAGAARTAFGRGDYARAIREWTSAAETGDGRAMYNLGVMYFTGKGVQIDQSAAAKWFSQAANAGHAGGMVNYGLMLLNGYGTTQDQAEGVRWLRRAADSGLGSAMGLMGQLYLQGEGVAKNPAQGVAWLQKAAQAGDGASMVELAGLYEDGRGAPRDLRRALSYYQKAADAGEGGGMVHLGYFYEDGDVVPQDLVQAATWYQRAAEAGDGEGMSALAVMFESGRGLPQSNVRAAQYYRMSANLNDARGLLGLGKLTATGTGVRQDDRQAVALFQRAADAGSAQAWRNLAVMYETGRGVPRDPAKAAELYGKALAAGDEGAAGELRRLQKR